MQGISPARPTTAKVKFGVQYENSPQSMVKFEPSTLELIATAAILAHIGYRSAIVNWEVNVMETPFHAELVSYEASSYLYHVKDPTTDNAYVATVQITDRTSPTIWVKSDASVYMRETTFVY